jgi:two-component system response regulator YesN
MVQCSRGRTHVLTLLIVDDERMTRESLAKYVAWSTVRIGSVRTARNGVEALAMADRDPPEILLTDVRMPKMDGLELAERVKALNPSCKVVFLSGYADKEYLKKAIHLQAISYVEKPVDLEEVKEAVRMAVNAFERDAADRQRGREERAIEREEITRRLVTGDSGVHSFLGGFEPHTNFTSGALLMEWSPALRESERTIWRRRVLSFCAECAPFNLATSFVGFVDMDVMALIAAKRIAHPSAFEALLGVLTGRAAGAFSASVGVGAPVRGLEALPAAWASARESLGLHFYREKEQVHFPAAGRAERFSVPREELARFRESLRDSDIERAMALVHETELAARRALAVDIDSVRDAFFMQYLTIFEGLGNTSEKTHIWHEIQERRTLTALTRFILHHLWSAFGEPAGQGRLSRKIREIQRFVRDNYMSTGLTLGVIAEHSGLSRTYVSSLYKAATGQNVNEYLTSLRIEKAKELLLDGHRKTHEVALSVGYRDANYFSALFKKRVGQSPSAYRESE